MASMYRATALEIQNQAQAIAVFEKFDAEVTDSSEVRINLLTKELDTPGAYCKKMSGY